MASGKILIISADNFEDTELICPRNRLQEAGYQTVLATPGGKDITGKHGYEQKADLAVEDLTPESAKDYKMLLLPGGKAPSALRKLEPVLAAAKGFDAAGLPIAAICHGPQILISAGLMKGKTATAYTSVQPELKEAGANVKDEEVVQDGPYIFSRNPKDIPAFNKAMITKLGG